MQHWVCKILLSEFVFHFPNISLVIRKVILKHFVILFLYIYFPYFLACLILKISLYLCTFFFLCMYMIINRFENFVFFLESTSPPKKIKSLFGLLVANTSLFYLFFFLAYNLTYILRFAIYGCLTKHLVVLLVNRRIISIHI